jgi:hypothetical protein
MTGLVNGTGVLLVVIGVGGWVLTDRVSPTALIPAALGAVLIVLGLVAARGESARRHAMHGAMLVALVGIAGTARGLMQLPAALSGGPVARPAAVYAQSLTALLLIVLLVAGIRSFIAARQAKGQRA